MTKYLKVLANFYSELTFTLDITALRRQEEKGLIRKLENEILWDKGKWKITNILKITYPGTYCRFAYLTLIKSYKMGSISIFHTGKKQQKEAQRK